ncbi:RNA polymerase sigma factor [Chitinophaga sp. 22321]|uniref:Sigma-70 family RNA polymerase sigma factor n=1 Tax=Chitinophaga hostae TaxID=2831022 RepID=A0ABS5J613_9BACT|nr:sigma-70 family RNA polymerase sigma factor [Chitinophaga hostae]MBS0030493.1 sigma-70 family RNA polymerase sigma factor [Chitinophaga hostae]
MSSNIPYNESELISRITEGDEQAFTIIFNHYYPLLFTYINRIVQSAPETESILQDIFLKIWQSREALQYVDQFRPYLWVMSRHHALNTMRNLARRMVILDDLSKQAPVMDPSGDNREWQLSLIDQAINQLPEHCRKVWMMNRIDKMKQAEIAATLGIALPTVKKYMQQAVGLIAQYVKERSSLGLALMLVLSQFFEKK